MIRIQVLQDHAEFGPDGMARTFGAGLSGPAFARIVLNATRTPATGLMPGESRRNRALHRHQRRKILSSPPVPVPPQQPVTAEYGLQYPTTPKSA